MITLHIGGSADGIRIPLLASKECVITRLYVHYDEAYLFLCVSTEEICKLIEISCFKFFANMRRMRLSSRVTSPNLDEEILNTIDTGSVLRGMYYPITQTPQTYTFQAAILIFAMEYRPTL